MATLLERPEQSTGARACTVEAASGLASIRQSEIDLVIWNRAVKDALHQEVAELSLDQLPAFRLESVALAELDAALAPHTAATPALGADIAELARFYARLLRLTRVRIRLETVTTDACSLFHVDRVRLRLLATYVGPGTDWLDVTAAPDARVRRLPEGAVALLKGSLWPGSPGCPHRSPPIRGTRRHRLVLSIDESPGR
jgi:hypothetical protein